jgi:hypothetical protein
MFESLCIRRTTNQGAPIDVGLLVEALVFYQKGHIVSDSGTLEFLVSNCGPQFLLNLMDRGVLTLSYLENMPGCLKSEKPGRDPRYDFALITSPNHSLDQSLPAMVRTAVKDPRLSEKLTRRLFGAIKIERHHPSIPELAREDASNQDTIVKIIEELITHKAPTYQLPSPVVFRFQRADELFSIHTNVDFAAINACIRQSAPQGVEEGSVTPESLLVQLPDVISDLHFAAKLKADLLTRPENELVAARKLGDIFSVIKARDQEIATFQEFVFDGGRAIRESINSGERILADAIALIDASARFKVWLKDKDPGDELLKEYCRELSRLELADRLPVKSLRWLVFAAIGFATATLNPAIGLLAGASDTFLVDRFLKGWKPNQFVEGPMRKFTR